MNAGFPGSVRGWHEGPDAERPQHEVGAEKSDGTRRPGEPIYDSLSPLLGER